MALRTKGSLVRVWGQRTPQVKMSLTTKGFRNSRLDTTQCPTTKGSLRKCISIDVCILFVTGPLQSLPKNAMLWGMNKPARDKSFRPRTINERRNTGLPPENSLNYWSAEIEKMKYWLQVRSNLNNFFTLWNENSTSLYFISKRILTWSEIRTPLIFAFILSVQNWNGIRNPPTEFHFYQVLCT